MNKKLSIMGLCMIMLVITIPFYSANVLAASIQVNKNEGQKGIESYVDAQGDVWTLEALITGAPNGTIDPSSVSLQIGDNKVNFQSCSEETLGVVCKLVSPLTDGVREGEHQFELVYSYKDANNQDKQVSTSDIIRADGSAPKITYNSVDFKQNNGKIELQFVVDDRKPAAPSVGIKEIQIIEADTGKALHTISNVDKERFDFVQDGKTGGKLPVEVKGLGQKALRIKAVDKLDHTTTSSTVQVEIDFEAPVIQDNLNLTKLDQFIGPIPIKTDILFDVVDLNLDRSGVVGFSSQAKLDGTPATCSPDKDDEKLFHCRWENVEIQPVTSVSIKIVAADEKGNIAEKTLTRKLVVDSSAPKVDFFGTPRVFEGRSHVKSGENLLVLRVSEQGAGIVKENIKANLKKFGKGTHEIPNGDCEATDKGLDCLWLVDQSFNSDEAFSAGFSELKDNVGNEGDLSEYQFVIDTTPPKVKEVEVYGFSGAEERSYFQSNDKLRIKFTAQEENGITVLVNVKDIINDAETKHPASLVTQTLSDGGDGWMTFTEKDWCERIEGGDWECDIEVGPIKSGPIQQAQFEVMIQDTAGNSPLGRDWGDDPKNVKQESINNGVARYSFFLAGLSNEANPDYWKVKKGKAQLLDQTYFVDLGAAKLVPTRAPFKFSLESDNPQAELLSMEVIGCAPKEATVQNAPAAVKPQSSTNSTTVRKTANPPSTPTTTTPQVGRSLLLGGDYPQGEANPEGKIVIELNPFDGKSALNLPEDDDSQVTRDYTCKLRLFTRVGDNALGAAEIQDVPVTIPFAYTSLGSIDATLVKKLKQLQDSPMNGYAQTMSQINNVLQWIRYIGSIVSTVITFMNFISLFQATKMTKSDLVEKTPAAKLGALLRGSCLADAGAEKPILEWVKYIEIPIQILSCSPSGLKSINTGATRWYGNWQQSVLDAYNFWSGRAVLGIPAASLYDNIYTSAVGLCVPGILHNMEKLGEIHCRKVLCYARDVPAGLATIESCNRLFDIQLCEFFTGPAFDFTPLGGAAQVGQAIKNTLSTPLAALNVVEYVLCSGFCFTPKAAGALTACKVGKGISYALDIVNSVAGMAAATPSVSASPYCKEAAKIKVDEVTGTIKFEEDKPKPKQPEKK